MEPSKNDTPNLLGKSWSLYVDLLRAAGANTTRAVQLAIMRSLHQVSDRMDPTFLSGFLPEANRIIAPSLDVANYSSLRIESLKVLILLLKKLSDHPSMMDAMKEVYTPESGRVPPGHVPGSEIPCG